MAPERFSGWSDPRSDVYALGATLYELLMLRPAFDESDRVKLIERVLHGSPPPPRQLDRRIPRDLETIVLKALAREPGERYATAGQLAEDLRRFVAGRPILARRSGSIERLWRWSRRNPWVAGAAGAVAAALVVTTVIAVLYADRQHHFATEQARANREITRLNADLGQQRRGLTASLAESNRLLAIRNFDRGQAAFEKDQIGAGLLWMVESWRSAVEARDPAWQHSARANLAAWRPHHARLKAVLSHESPVDAAAFSPDGKTVLTGGDDRFARLWDVASGRPVGQPIRHEGVVASVAFSLDGKTLLTGCTDKTARLWDAATGQPVGTPLSHGKAVGTVAFSPDGKTFLVGIEGTARLWNIATQRPIGEPFEHQNAPESVAFSPDGKTLITGVGATARLWNIATREPLGLPLQHRAAVAAVAFTPDSKSVITGCGDGTVQWWDAATRKPVGEPMHHHQLRVRAMAISPDGRTVLTASEDKTARLWDAVTNQPIARPLVHQGPVVAVAFSPDGKTFLTASSDNTVRLWDAGPDQPFGLILENQAVGHAVAYSPDSKSILTGGYGGTAKRWDAATGEMIGPIISDQGPVGAVAFSPDGKTLLTGGGDGTARLRDAATGEPIGAVLRHEGSVQRGGILSRWHDGHDRGRGWDGTTLGCGDGDVPRPTHPASRPRRWRGLQSRRQVLRGRLRQRLGAGVGPGGPVAPRPAVTAPRLHQLGGLQPRRQDPPDRLRGWRGPALGRGKTVAPHGPPPPPSLDMERGLQPRRQDPPDRQQGCHGPALGRRDRDATRSAHPALLPGHDGGLQPRRQDLPDGGSRCRAALPQGARIARRPGAGRHLGGGPHRPDARRETGHDPGPRQCGLEGASRTAGASRQPAGNGGRAEARSHPHRSQPAGPLSSLVRAGVVGPGRGSPRRARPCEAALRVESAGARRALHRAGLGSGMRPRISLEPRNWSPTTPGCGTRGR